VPERHLCTNTAVRSIRSSLSYAIAISWQVVYLVYITDQHVGTNSIGATPELLAKWTIFAVIIAANGPPDSPGWYFDSLTYSKGHNPPQMGGLLE
jgi:hypothetical protein